MIVFKESGRYSKPWWLQLINNYGNGGVGQINVKAGGGKGSYALTRSAISHLLNSGDIEVRERSHAGWAKKRVTVLYYVLTLKGESYLECNKSKAVVGAK